MSLVDGDILPSKIYAAREDPWGEGISIRYGFQTVGVGWTVAAPITMVKMERNVPVEPFIRFTMHEAQMLMDSLWDCGLRPTEGSGSAGALAATQRHLDDMRTLVFKNIGE